jgi:GNAT superfamily N-acetyltransferase
MTSAAPGARTGALLRGANTEDAAGVAKLLGELGYTCTADDAALRIAEVREEPTQRLVVADLHGELCGLLALDFMYYLPLGRDTCRITALVVGDMFRKLGIGRELLRFAEHEARLRGAARIEVTTAEHRHAAHDFYRACGYGASSLRFVKQLSDA